MYVDITVLDYGAASSIEYDLFITSTYSRSPEAATGLPSRRSRTVGRGFTGSVVTVFAVSRYVRTLIVPVLKAIFYRNRAGMLAGHPIFHGL